MAWNRRRKVGMAKGMWVGRLAMISAIAVSLSLWYVWQRVQMVNVGYQIREKERKLSTVKKENQVLRMKIAQMKSPKNIEAMIRAKELELVSTKNWQLVVLPKTGSQMPFRNILPSAQAPKLMDNLRSPEPAARVPMR